MKGGSISGWRTPRNSFLRWKANWRKDAAVLKPAGMLPAFASLITHPLDRDADPVRRHPCAQAYDTCVDRRHFLQATALALAVKARAAAPKPVVIICLLYTSDAADDL